MDKQIIYQLAEEKLSGTDNYIVDVYIKQSNKIFVEIDNDKGVSIKDCVSLSRFIESNLNREEEDFELQVSSPGIDQPFKILRQYHKNIGRPVEVLTNDGKKLSGKLLSVNDKGIVISAQVKEKKEHKKANKVIIANKDLFFDQIKETKAIISFK